MKDATWMLRPGLLPGLVGAAVDGSGHQRSTARDHVVDVTCVLLSAGLALVGVAFPLAGIRGSYPLIISAAVLASLSLLLRKRFPIALSVVLMIISSLLPVVSAASMIALFTAAVHRRLRAVLPLVLLAGASAYAQLSTGLPIAPSQLRISTVVVVLVSLLVVAWGVVTRSRRELVLLLAERLQRLRDEQDRRVREAGQAVREGIARDLHDSLGHRLSLISMSAGALHYRSSMPREDFTEMVGIVRANAQLSLAELREVVTVLRDQGGLALTGPDQGDGGSRDGLEGLIVQARSAGQNVGVSWSAPVDAVSPEIAEAVHHFVREGLSNARKHAPDRRVDLVGRQRPDHGLTVRLSNGNPPSASRSDPGSGSGLASLDEHIRLSGGRLRVEEDVAQFVLTAVWPSGHSCPVARESRS